MATIELNDDFIRFDQGSLIIPRTVVDTRSTTGIITQRRGNFTRRIFRGRFIAATRSEVNYLRGVVQPAIDDAEQIEFTLPPEFVQYDGTYTGNLFVRADTAADSNTVRVSTSSTTQTSPGVNALVQGNYIKFGTDPTLYIINSYNAATADVIVSPRLRQAIDVSADNTVSYNNLTFRGHVTSNVQEEIFNGVTTAMRMSIVVEESL